MNTIPNSFEEACAAYTNTAEGNDAAHALFTAAVRADPVLHEHRTHIETHQLGFGDPAFHYLWKLLVAHSGRHPSPHFLEIGVFKGQVLSLWALLAGQLQVRASLHAISPLRGSPLPGPWTTRILRWFPPISAIVSKTRISTMRTITKPRSAGFSPAMGWTGSKST